MLRHAVELNMRDYILANSLGYRLVYVFDANVVGFFLRPENEVHHIKSIAPPPSRLTASLTAEFLFSRDLAGQWGDAPYLAPSHAEDVASMLGRLREKISEIDLDAPVPPPDDAERLVKIIETLQRDEQPSHDILERIGRILPAAVRPLIEPAALEARQFIRLHEQELLRPLWLDRYLTDDIVHPPEAISGAWLRRLHAAGRSVDERTRRDALALAQIERLNEDMEAADEPVRYLLVSSDNRVHRAYHTWYWQADGPFFALRHPVQYVPMLNVQEMDNDIDSTDLTAVTQRTLDVCFAGIRRDDDRYPLVLPQLIEEAEDDASELFHDGPLQREMLKELERCWAEAEDNAAMLSAEMLRHRKEYSLGPLRDLLASRRFKEAALDYQTWLIREVEGYHLTLVAQADLAEIMDRLEQMKVVGPRRAPLLLRADFSPFTGERDLDDLLDSLQDQKDGAAIRVLTDRIKKRPGARALLFTAIIAFRAAQWTACGNLASRARTTFVNQGAKREDADYAHLQWEAVHLLCLAARFDEGIVDVGHHIDGLVEEALQACEARGDLFGYCRALHDAAAGQIRTVLTACLREPEADRGWLVRLLDEAALSLERMADVMVKREQASEDEAVLFATLDIQRSVSVLDCVTLAGLLSHQTAFSDDDIAGAVLSADQALKAGRWPFSLMTQALITWHAARRSEDQTERERLLAEVERLHDEADRCRDRLREIDLYLLAVLAQSSKARSTQPS